MICPIKKIYGFVNQNNCGQVSYGDYDLSHSQPADFVF